MLPGSNLSAYVPIVLILIFKIYLFKETYSAAHYLFLFIMTSISIVFLLNHLSDNYNLYYINFVLIGLAPFVFRDIIRLIDTVDRNLMIYYLLSFIICTPVILKLFIFGERGNFIFGPNVYYRIILFNFALIIVSKSKFNLVQLFFMVTATASTLSRGGFVAMILLLSRNKHFFNSNIIKFFAIFTSVPFIYIYRESLWIALTSVRRIFLFSSQLLSDPNSSSGSRIYNWKIFFGYFDKGSFSEYLMGQGPNNSIYDYYPHNIILENFVYNGVIWGFLSVVSVLFLFIYAFSNKNNSFNKLAVVLLPVCVGSQFSGSMIENFPVIAFFAYFLLRRAHESCNSFSI
ncbi:hypothetical protein N9V53_05295 [Amylibacter sp.]|nr:hypothetical protein [Amylibacter sp.]